MRCAGILPTPVRTVEWIPARVGLSADGRHGYTAGFMTVKRADGTVQSAKYMSYWEKQSRGLARAGVQARAGAGGGAGDSGRPRVAGEDHCCHQPMPRRSNVTARASRMQSVRSRVMRRPWASARRSSCTAVPMPPTLAVRTSRPLCSEMKRSELRSARAHRRTAAPCNWGPEKTIDRGERRLRRHDRLHRPQPAGSGPSDRLRAGRQDPSWTTVLHDLAPRWRRRALAIHRGVIGLRQATADQSRQTRRLRADAREHVLDGRVVLGPAQRVTMLHDHQSLEGQLVGRGIQRQ